LLHARKGFGAAGYDNVSSLIYDTMSLVYDMLSYPSTAIGMGMCHALGKSGSTSDGG
tara:strand:+ start:913 stop:1083 length:171 start_codon:yes stop_codon:yes gene_type:complete